MAETDPFRMSAEECFGQMENILAQIRETNAKLLASYEAGNLRDGNELSMDLSRLRSLANYMGVE
jgi:hypothetical protein